MQNRCPLKIRIKCLISTELLQEIEQNSEALLDGSCPEGSSTWRKSYIITQRALAMCQDSGDEKLHLLATISEHIENRTRSLDQYRENLGMAISFICFNFLSLYHKWVAVQCIFQKML